MERGEVVKMMIEASAGVNRGIDDFFSSRGAAYAVFYLGEG
jgi:hypothetical protein